MGLLKSIRCHVTMDKDARTTMSSASDKPKKPHGFREPFFMLAFH
ncbi:hypothetical protein ACZ87_02197 [Candidatus Erwinia dacicola]|uniref:Uncharacterized protein n=1 Tax=Candidatus Erwinia dacicola TaxID=252393 RepID=A0A328TK48_9GAMM|nr:hypothetical protein ACZ87_02197 [Candidatus Erwinia dacicola]